MIKHEGKHWVLYSSDGSKKLGTHDSEAEAMAQEKAIEIAKHKNAEARALHLIAALGKVSTEMIDNKEHLVVPVVMLMEGVIHAVNAETPEFVPYETLEKAAESWNGCPVTLGHPKKNGVQCSANDPGIWDAHGIGVIRNARADAASKKMLGEALIETARAKRLHPDMYQRLAEGGTEEVSVGALVISDKKAGTHGPKPFLGSWTYAKGDHLAFLPGGRGACSVEMGCGTHRAAMRVCEDHLELETLSNPEGINQYSKGGGGAAGSATRDALSASAQADKSGRGTDHKEAESAHQFAADLHTKAGNTKVAREHRQIANTHHAKASDASPGQTQRYRGLEARLPSEEGPEQRIPSCLVFSTLEDQPLNDRIVAVQMAVMDEWNDPPEPPAPYAYASQVFDDFVIVCKGEETYKVPYTVDKDGKVSLGKPVAVKQQWVAAASADTDLRVLAGARHSNKDMSLIQEMHDHTMALGATCDRGNYKLMEGKIKEGTSKLDESKLNDPNRFYIQSVRQRVAGAR